MRIIINNHNIFKKLYVKNALLNKTIILFNPQYNPSRFVMLTQLTNGNTEAYGGEATCKEGKT